MGYPHHSDKCKRIAAAVLSGRSYEDVAAEFGVKPLTARRYATEARNGDGRMHRGNEPRCKCGLLLPCECGGRGLRVEDFARGGSVQASLAFSGSFRDW